MIRLLTLRTLERKTVHINPEHVAAVLEAVEGDHATLLLASGITYHVEQDPARPLWQWLTGVRKSHDHAMDVNVRSAGTVTLPELVEIAASGRLVSVEGNGDIIITTPRP